MEATSALCHVYFCVVWSVTVLPREENQQLSVIHPATPRSKSVSTTSGFLRGYRRQLERKPRHHFGRGLYEVMNLNFYLIFGDSKPVGDAESLLTDKLETGLLW